MRSIQDVGFLTMFMQPCMTFKTYDLFLACDSRKRSSVLKAHDTKQQHQHTLEMFYEVWQPVSYLDQMMINTETWTRLWESSVFKHFSLSNKRFVLDEDTPNTGLLWYTTTLKFGVSFLCIYAFIYLFKLEINTFIQKNAKVKKIHL